MRYRCSVSHGELCPKNERLKKAITGIIVFLDSFILYFFNEKTLLKTYFDTKHNGT